MKKIPLTRGLFAIVDDDDYERLARFRWTAKPYPKTTYAHMVRNGRSVLLHRLLLRVGAGVRVDHEDGDGLNNRRGNLRIATAFQNAANRRTTRKWGRVHSRFKGVTWNARKRQWHARITAGRVCRHLGYFDSDKDAAEAYDKAARRLFKEFACPNFRR